MEELRLKLEKKIKISGKIKLLTGLHIGGSSIGLEIGGADKVVIRNPVDQVPYIPGSSLKGKMRSLIEKSMGLVKIEEAVYGGKKEFRGLLCTDQSEDAVQLFGFAANDSISDERSAPTRLIVRDASLDKESFRKLESAENTDMYLTEIKTETSIDRLTSQANPRSFERVPAGSSFDFEFIIDIYNVDLDDKSNTRETRFIEIVKNAMKLLEYDYLGGQGSRGYGRVKFEKVSVKVIDAASLVEEGVKTEEMSKELTELFS